MKSLLRLTVLLCVSFAAAVALAEPEWPATEPGRHARDYFPAYNGGEDAMRAYFAAHVSAEDLKARPVDMRIGIWRQIQANQGALTPIRVLESADDHCGVLVRNGSGGTLRIDFNCHAEPPHSLVALMIEPVDEEVGGHATPPPAPPAPAGPPPTDDQIVARLGKRLDSLATAGRFSGTALLDKSGKPLYSKALGLASRAEKRPNTMETRFNIGSLNKIFTTVAIHQLAQKGELKLDDTIDRWLTDYPQDAAKKITIAMLLDHRSGVPDVLRNPKLAEHPGNVRTASDWYAMVRDLPLDFEPGARQRYSNGGFVLLGKIIEIVSGEDYYAYIRKHVYGPAGMKSTDSYSPEERKGGDFATAYSTHPDGPPGMMNADPNAPFLEAPHPFGRGSAAGGGYSTAGDLLRFAAALRAGKLLDADHTRAIIGEGPGLGIAGGSPGVNAMLEITGPYTLVVLANLDPPAAEQFATTTGRDLRRASGAGDGPRKVVHAGGSN